MSDYNLALKVPMPMIERLDALVSDVEAAYVDLRAAGLVRKVSRSTVARLALDAGIGALETKYRDTPPPVAPKRAPAAPCEPDDTEPASALLRAYGGRKPSRRSKPETRAGRLLRQWRESNALSQVQAAERIGKKQAQWGRYERGTHNPPAAIRAELERLAGISPDDWTTPADGEG
ncbi:MAG: helix-turn-helix domain-containing protein [Armatimonadetes bacterium]|nr:helix-turn-helix domain-containing protein [Armatimonadota bacterium]